MQKPQTKGSWQEFVLTNPFPHGSCALGLTGELAEPFRAFPSVKSIFGWEPHTFYELLREMALEPEPAPFSKSWAVHFGNSLKVRLLHQSQPQAHKAKPSVLGLQSRDAETFWV